MKIKLIRYAFISTALTLAACGYPTPPCLAPSADIAWVVAPDWHSELAIPVGELGPSLEPITAQFPGAKTLLFGYGRESFMTAEPGDTGKYLTAAFPGYGAIRVEGLSVDPVDVYAPDQVVKLALPDGGAAKLSAYINDDIARDEFGAPRLLLHQDNPPAYTYAANSGYTFLHTCNGWVADALADAGVSISPSRVVTSERLMDRARESVERCELEKLR